MEQEQKNFVRSIMSFMGHSDLFPEDRTVIHFGESHSEVLAQPKVTSHFHHRPAMEPSETLAEESITPP